MDSFVTQDLSDIKSVDSNIMDSQTSALSDDSYRSKKQQQSMSQTSDLSDMSEPRQQQMNYSQTSDLSEDNQPQYASQTSELSNEYQSQISDISKAQQLETSDLSDISEPRQQQVTSQTSDLSDFSEPRQPQQMNYSQTSDLSDFSEPRQPQVTSQTSDLSDIEDDDMQQQKDYPQMKFETSDLSDLSDFSEPRQPQVTSQTSDLSDVSEPRQQHVTSQTSDLSDMDKIYSQEVPEGHKSSKYQPQVTSETSDLSDDNQLQKTYSQSSDLSEESTEELTKKLRQMINDENVSSVTYFNNRLQVNDEGESFSQLKITDKNDNKVIYTTDPKRYKNEDSARLIAVNQEKRENMERILSDYSDELSNVISSVDEKLNENSLSSRGDSLYSVDYPVNHQSMELVADLSDTSDLSDEDDDEQMFVSKNTEAIRKMSFTEMSNLFDRKIHDMYSRLEKNKTATVENFLYTALKCEIGNFIETTMSKNKKLYEVLQNKPKEQRLQHGMEMIKMFLYNVLPVYGEIMQVEENRNFELKYMKHYTQKLLSKFKLSY